MKATHLFAVLSLLAAVPAFAAEVEDNSPAHLKRLNISCEFRREGAPASGEHERYTTCESLASVTVREGLEIGNYTNKLAIACSEHGDNQVELVYADGATVTKIRHEDERFLKLQATGAADPKILIKLERENMENAPADGLRALLVLGEHQRLVGQCIIRRDDRQSLD